jgi:glycosyltransferase involved in cell wall biosynthesis
MPELSIIIPCLNEERTIGACVRSCRAAFQREAIDGEVVVIDNGSTDSTSSVAQKENARVVLHTIRGYGSALMRGITESKGRYIIMADGDDTYEFSAIGKFLAVLHGGVDLVMGTRFKGTMDHDAMPWLHRYFGTPFLTAVLNALFRTSLTDINCGMRGFSKEAVEKLRLERPGMEFAAEMIIKAAALNFRIEEISVHYKPGDPERKPHVRTFRDGWRHLWFMLASFPRYGTRRSGRQELVNRTKA